MTAGTSVSAGRAHRDSGSWLARHGARRLIVSGSSGRIGRRFLSRALAGGSEVLAVVRAGRSRSLPVHPRLRVVEDDGTQSLTRVLDAFQGDVCVHLATSWVSTPSPLDVAAMAQANVAFGIRLADAHARTGGQQFVNAATYFQRGGVPGSGPLNAYAAMKDAFECYLRWMASRGDVRVLNLEVFDTYSPRDPRPTVWTQFMAAARSGVPFPTSAGEQLVAPLHIEDAADGFLVATRVVAEQTASWSDQHVAGPRVLRLREALQVLAEVVEADVEVLWGARGYSGSEVFEFSPRGARLTGWSPRWSLEAGLRAVWAAEVEDLVRS